MATPKISEKVRKAVKDALAPYAHAGLSPDERRRLNNVALSAALAAAKAPKPAAPKEG